MIAYLLDFHARLQHAHPMREMLPDELVWFMFLGELQHVGPYLTFAGGLQYILWRHRGKLALEFMLLQLRKYVLWCGVGHAAMILTLFWGVETYVLYTALVNFSGLVSMMTIYVLASNYTGIVTVLRTDA